MQKLMDNYVKLDLQRIEELKQKEKEIECLKHSVRSNKDRRKRAIEKYKKLKDYSNKLYKLIKRIETFCKTTSTCDKILEMIKEDLK